MKIFEVRPTNSIMLTAVLALLSVPAIAQEDGTQTRPRPIILPKPKTLAVNNGLGYPAPAAYTPPAYTAPAYVPPAAYTPPAEVAPVKSAPANVPPPAEHVDTRPASAGAAEPSASYVGVSNVAAMETGAMPAPAATTTYNGGGGRARNFDDSAPVEQVLHVQVGRSIFVDTKHRLTRVYVTDPTVLNSYTSSPNQIVVTAIKPGNSTVIVWDEAGDSKAYIVSSDMDVDGLRGAIKEAFPAESIAVHGNAERVELTGFVGTDAAAEAAGKMALQYSKEVSNSLVVNTSRVKQVRMKVRIVEVDRSKLAQFGFNFFSAGGNNLASTTTQAYSSTLNVGASGGSSVGNKTVTVSNPLNFLFYSSKFNVGATIQDLADMNILEILAEPTITAMSGQKANFLAGGEFPFPVVQAGGASLAATVTIQFRPYGVKLEFTPKVNPDGTVDLKVAPEVSALDFSNAVTIAGYTIPAISTRRAETEMVLQSGQSFAIAGLLDQRITDGFGHTPGISSVPILGELFKSKNTTGSKTELIVIVTPTLVDPVSEPGPFVAPPAPAEPSMPIPMIDPNKFDKELPKGAKKPQ